MYISSERTWSIPTLESCARRRAFTYSRFVRYSCPRKAQGYHEAVQSRRDEQLRQWTLHRCIMERPLNIQRHFPMGGVELLLIHLFDIWYRRAPSPNSAPGGDGCITERRSIHSLSPSAEPRRQDKIAAARAFWTTLGTCGVCDYSSPSPQMASPVPCRTPPSPRRWNWTAPSRDRDIFQAGAGERKRAQTGGNGTCYETDGGGCSDKNIAREKSGTVVSTADCGLCTSSDVPMCRCFDLDPSRPHSMSPSLTLTRENSAAMVACRPGGVGVLVRPSRRIPVRSRFGNQSFFHSGSSRRRPL